MVRYSIRKVRKYELAGFLAFVWSKTLTISGMILEFRFYILKFMYLKFNVDDSK